MNRKAYLFSATLCPGTFLMHPLRLCFALLLACWTADAACGQSFGHWHLPSTTAQVFGYGNGAGHHAPIVRTLDCNPERVPRVAFVPCKSRVGCSACKRSNFLPMPMAPAGCTGGQCQQQYPRAMQQRQQMMQQQYLPVEQVTPTAAEPQQVFLAPPTLPMPMTEPIPSADPTPAESR